jgi:N-acetylmuramic acid 6-phosphate (MurNAc-6-P) etherase
MKPALVQKAVEVVHGLEDHQDVAEEDVVAEDVAAEDVVEKDAAAGGDAFSNRNSDLRKMMVISRI